jgi:hypothetical protein
MEEALSPLLPSSSHSSLLVIVIVGVMKIAHFCRRQQTSSLNARIQPCFDAMDWYNNLGSRSIQPWSYDDDDDDDDDRSRISCLFAALPARSE